MFGKSIVTILLLFFTNLTVSANCVTGYACSLSDLEKQQSEKASPVEKQIKNNINPHKNNVKKEKKKGFFRDRKELNRPEYTEVFTIKDIPMNP